MNQSYVQKKFANVQAQLLDLTNIFTILEISQNAPWHELIERFHYKEPESEMNIYLRIHS